MTVMLSTTNNNNNNNNKGKKPYKSWLKDGVHGGPSSMDILLAWLSHLPNYRKWKREDYLLDRVSKKDLLEEIIDKLRQVGIYHRLAKDVASKISTLQSNYRMTRKWSENEGKLKTTSKKSMHAEILKRFPYWDTLHPVFSSNHGSGSAIVSTTYNNMSQMILNNHKLIEERKMEKSRNMLYFLTQRKRQKMTYERHLIQQEILNTKLYFKKSLHEAGFTDTEIKYFYNKNYYHQ